MFTTLHFHASSSSKEPTPLCKNTPDSHPATVPIQHVAAEELKLPTHVIDTFTSWTPPVSTNLVVAVSFGLLVPPRILGLAKYGGLNVHPSLLPDLRGPAPIAHAILKRREHTGVSIQTLHPQHFDQGTVLAQTPKPGIKIPRHVNANKLEAELAAKGAQMLLEVLKVNKHVLPHENAAWYDGPVSHAPKTTKKDRFVSFGERSMDEIVAMMQALGDPWCMLSNGNRLLLHQITLEDSAETMVPGPGLWIRHGVNTPVFQAKDGVVGVVKSSTYSGAKTGSGNAKVVRMLPLHDMPKNSTEGSTEDLKWVRVDQH